jgi:hypothetical protein
MIGHKLSQQERILRTLEEHPEGVHSFVFIRDHWILRPANRVMELKRQGINIISLPERMGNARGVRYQLVK